MPSVRREQLILPSQKNAHKLRNFSDKTLNVSTISGVSGIHRLLSKVDRLQKANCVVAVAGMEGALASVIGGARSQSRYCGSHFCRFMEPISMDFSALLTMINSCSNGVATVNIDNGFGAGFFSFPN